MGTRIITAPQVRNRIQSLVERNLVDNELAQSWRANGERKKRTEDSIRRAEGGNVDAMLKLARLYRNGSDGSYRIKQDHYKACEWYEKMHLAGDVRGTANFGNCLRKGVGTEQDTERGNDLIRLAAGKGSDYSAYMLGKTLANGSFGCDIDLDEARRWLEVSISGDCVIKHLSAVGKQNARRKLSEVIDEVLRLDLD